LFFDYHKKFISENKQMCLVGSIYILLHTIGR
jgi:hypothetical protein